MDQDSVTDAPIPLMKPVPPVSVSAPTPVEPVAPLIPVAATPQPRTGNWGGLISIVLIVFFITIAAFYSWGERLALQSIQNTDAAAPE